MREGFPAALTSETEGTVASLELQDYLSCSAFSPENTTPLTEQEIQNLEIIRSAFMRQHIAEHGFKLGTPVEMWGTEAATLYECIHYTRHNGTGRRLLIKHADLLTPEEATTN